MINGAKIGNNFEKCKDLREVLSLKATKEPSGDSCDSFFAEMLAVWKLVRTFAETNLEATNGRRYDKREVDRAQQCAALPGGWAVHLQYVPVGGDLR